MDGSTVIDLTDSPPLEGGNAAAFAATSALPPGGHRHTGDNNNSVVVVSSDDDRPFPGVTPLPAGYVLPPIQRHPAGEHSRPERITTLRDVLSTRNSRQRARSMLFRQRAGLQMQHGMFMPHVLPHTGDEPVEAGVYYPIRARPMLPGQRQRQRQGRAHQRPLSPSRAGRETADGSIDVEDVQEADSGSASDTSFIGEDMMNLVMDEDEDDIDDDNDDEYTTDDDDDGEPPLAPPLVHPGSAAGQTFIDYLMMRQQLQAGRRAGVRGAHPAAAYAFPFHPGLVPPHMRMGTSGQITPFDFFPGEDISNLLSFLEATTPAPPTRPMAPAPPLKLSKRQEELAALPDYSRAVPPANFRDSTAPAAPDHLEIVCAQCTSTLHDKEPVWAPSCGHVLCNSCVDAFTAASKACAACRKRIPKKSLVHLYL